MRNISFSALALSFGVLATHCTSPNAAPAPPAAQTLAKAFGIDGKPIGCRAFNMYVGDAARTTFLRLRVDTAALGLKAGRHQLDLKTVKSAVAIDLVVYDAANRELPDCSDATLPQPKISARWTTSGGRLSVRLSADPEEGKNFKVSIALDDIRFVGPAGEVRIIDAQFDDVEVGWLPG